MLQAKRRLFKKAHGREPLVWFDKYSRAPETVRPAACVGGLSSAPIDLSPPQHTLPFTLYRYCIDQTAIDLSVRRLPFFVVASQKMLVLLGPSYAQRCWCMLELFVFTSCQRCGLFDEAELEVEPLHGSDASSTSSSSASPPAGSSAPHSHYSHLEKLARSFRIHDTACYRDVDRETIFGIVETAGDGSAGFTDAVRALARAAGERSDLTERRWTKVRSKGAETTPAPAHAVQPV